MLLENRLGASKRGRGAIQQRQNDQWEVKTWQKCVHCEYPPAPPLILISWVPINTQQLLFCLVFSVTWLCSYSLHSPCPSHKSETPQPPREGAGGLFSSELTSFTFVQLLTFIPYILPFCSLAHISILPFFFTLLQNQLLPKAGVPATDPDHPEWPSPRSSPTGALPSRGTDCGEYGSTWLLQQRAQVNWHPGQTAERQHHGALGNTQLPQGHTRNGPANHCLGLRLINWMASWQKWKDFF